MIKELEKELDTLTGFNAKYVITEETLKFKCSSTEIVITRDNIDGCDFKITHLELLKKLLETEEGKKLVANAVVDLKIYGI